MTAAEAPVAIHDKRLAETYLKALDPSTDRFTFQFLSEDSTRKYAEVFHGTLDEAWRKAMRLNISSNRVGVYVVVNETDLKGRRRENIKRVRALFIDADGPDQVLCCEETIAQTGATPTMVVHSSPGKAHYYWVVDDVGCDEFAAIQDGLIRKFGTDPAVKDLPRVMRLPGTLHLKDASHPHLVTLELEGGAHCRSSKALVAALGVVITAPALPAALGDRRETFPEADRDRLRRLFGDDYLMVGNELSAGLETNIEEIRSAVSAIPSSAIALEPEWVKLARGMAHEARIYKAQADELYDILDRASAAAPNYDATENRLRWDRYFEEALSRTNPITIATVFAMAKKHGWTGWSPQMHYLEGNQSIGPNSSGLSSIGRVSFANIPHRHWLYGVDLVRGEITLLAAPGGVGKSSLAIGMSVSAAVSRALLKERVWDSPLTSLYVNAEDSASEMRRRIWAFCLHHGIDEQDLERFLMLGADDRYVQQLSFLRTEKGASLLDEAGIQQLEGILNTLCPDVLVLDPLVALCGGGNLNDNAAMALVMRALKRVANKYDCAILVLHHTRKGGDLSHADAIGGASAIVNLARRALMAVPMSPEEASALSVLPSERSRYLKIVSSKSNLALNSADTPWYKLCSVTLRNPEPPIYPAGDGVQAIERAHLPLSTSPATADDQKVRRAILDVIAQGKLVGDRRVPYSPNISGAKNERALIDDAVAAARAATAPRTWHEADLRAVVVRAVDGLKSERALAEEEIKSGRFRRGRGLKVDWSRTPWAHEHSAVDEPPAPGPQVDRGGGQLVNGVVND